MLLLQDFFSFVDCAFTLIFTIFITDYYSARTCRDKGFGKKLKTFLKVNIRKYFQNAATYRFIVVTEIETMMLLDRSDTKIMSM